MQTAWRERDPQARINAAKEALEKNAECATALILLAEEECTQVIEVEKMLKQALKVAEVNYRKSQQYQHQSSGHEALYVSLPSPRCSSRRLILYSPTSAYSEETRMY